MGGSRCQGGVNVLVHNNCARWPVQQLLAKPWPKSAGFWVGLPVFFAPVCWTSWPSPGPSLPVFGLGRRLWESSAGCDFCAQPWLKSPVAWVGLPVFSSNLPSLPVAVRIFLRFWAAIAQACRFLGPWHVLRHAQCYMCRVQCCSLACPSLGTIIFSDHLRF